MAAPPLILAKREAVSARRADDDAGAEAGPGPGHEDLQGLARMLGLLVWPQRVHQPGRAAPQMGVCSQERKQTRQPGAGNLQAAVPHPRQQGQLNRHRHQTNPADRAVAGPERMAQNALTPGRRLVIAVPVDPADARRA
jgi:hypothetical protein